MLTILDNFNIFLVHLCHILFVIYKYAEKIVNSFLKVKFFYGCIVRAAIYWIRPDY